MPWRRGTVRTSAALAAFAVSAALAACGADDEPAEGGAGRTVTETVTRPPPPAEDPAGSGGTGGGTPSDPGDGEPPDATDDAPPGGAPAPAGPTRCGDVTITPNSGDGAFDVRVSGLGCAEAERLIKSPDGLTTWDCRPVGGSREVGGSQTIRCRDGGREIVFETGV